MRAFITVIGKDTVGIIANVSSHCAKYNVNVEEVTQSVLEDVFAMIMMVDISKINVTFTEFTQSLDQLGKELGLSIHTMHQDIFDSMHRI